ncbi:restriction endonuclease subunit S [Methylosarcina fibrata]|uniref:restriction endonuclease subunit S n=1 Tax=Methylosarcina fibrata TaxID=105972 RepID=UPI00036D3D77|nr:restriction endonuclease subunit S [Methylosarcina fibrata]
MSWQPRRLDQLGYVSRGRSRHRPRDAAHLYGGSYPFIQTGDVKHAGLYITSCGQTYSEAGLEQSKLWPVGTLCITIAANIADTAILGIEACFPDSVIGFIADPEKADPRFIKYLFDAEVQKRFKQFTQGAAQDNLSQEKLLSLEFKIPIGVDEQKRIADLLSAYDGLIENNRRRMALLEESARLLYREWFVRLRFPGYEHTRMIDGVPEGWDRKTVGSLGKIITGKTPSTKDLDNFGSFVPFIKTPDMHTSSIVLFTEEYLSEKGANSQRHKTLPLNSILVACIGAKLGVVSLNGLESQTNQQINAVVPTKESFTYYSYFTLKEFRQKLLAIGGGATMPNVNKSKFESMPVIIPAEHLLSSFHETVKQNFEQIKTLILMNKKLETARDLLLPRLMSGEIAA